MSLELPEEFKTDKWAMVRKTVETFNTYGKRRYRPTRLSLKLAKRIKDECGIAVFPVIFRTYAGYWQRTEGTWSWGMWGYHGNQVGSQWPASEVVKWETLVHGEEGVGWHGTDNYVTFGDVSLTPS